MTTTPNPAPGSVPSVSNGAVNLPTVTSADIQDPNLTRLNRVFKLIGNLLTNVTGGNGPFTFLSNISAPSIYSTLGDPSATPSANQFLTLAAAEKIFGEGSQGPAGPPGAIVSTVEIESRKGITLTGATPAEVAILLGERPSLNSFNGVGDGATDNRNALQSLINAVSAIGGGTVNIPAGNYLLSNYVLVPGNVWIVGFGVASQLTRGGAITSGFGLLTVQAGSSNVLFSNFLIEGSTPTPTTVNYSSVVSPEQANFIANTSIWIQPGVSGFMMNSVTIQHTGGYSCFIDVRTATSSNFKFNQCYFTNNRPFLFTDGTYTTGGWPGGIYVSGVCSSGAPYYLNGLRATDCHWSRNAGTCLWSHSNDFYVQHLLFRVSGCTFEDCGLDGVLFGNVAGGGVRDCDFHRIGYTTTSDTSTPTPGYIPGKYAVAIDTAGYATNICHSNNTMMSINGGGYDLDGMRNSVIQGGSMYIPYPTDPLYGTDSVSEFGYLVLGVQTQVTKGINFGNTNQNGAANGISIQGVLINNMGETAVSMSYAKYCVVQGCNITHPATAQTTPVVYNGTTGGSPADEFYCYLNTVTGNTFNYAGGNFCVSEQGGECSGNNTYGNIIIV